MGCITSRDKWPPDPQKRTVVRWEKRMVLDGARWVAKLVPVEDYVIDWPSLRCSGSSRGGAEDVSTLQANAIRSLEGD